MKFMAAISDNNDSVSEGYHGLYYSHEFNIISQYITLPLYNTSGSGIKEGWPIHLTIHQMSPHIRIYSCHAVIN